MVVVVRAAAVYTRRGGAEEGEQDHEGGDEDHHGRGGGAGKETFSFTVMFVVIVEHVLQYPLAEAQYYINKATDGPLLLLFLTPRRPTRRAVFADWRETWLYRS